MINLSQLVAYLLAIVFVNAACEDAMGDTIESKPLNLSYLYSDGMITHSLRDWIQGLRTQEQDLPSGWTVKKVEHMKNFHFSSTMHEYLRFSIEEKSGNSNNAGRNTYLIVERLNGKDEVTVGWKCIQHPRLTPWWIQRLWRGYFGDPNDGSPLASVLYTVNNWRAVGYSASDFLCSLTFEGDGISLLSLADVIEDTSETEPRGTLVGANGFWFAYTIYEALKEAWPCEESRGQYFKYRAKFAGLSFLPYDLVSRLSL